MTDYDRAIGWLAFAIAALLLLAMVAGKVFEAA
jgi:hypothetical protein